jgi:hypothetical protein
MKAGRLERTSFFTGAPETLRVLGLKIDFATDTLGSQTTTPDGKFDLRDGRSLGVVIDPPPHDRKFFMSHLEALRRYWKFASYGHLVIEYDVYPKADSSAYRLADTGRYGPWTLGQESFDSAQRFFHDAVTAADQTDSIPFGRFDVVALFHAGSDFQTDLNGDSQRDFPTFQINLNDTAFVNGGAVGITGGLVMPETESQDGYYAAINGTLAHEFGHTQGLFDLYDIETLLPGVGLPPGHHGHGREDGRDGGRERHPAGEPGPLVQVPPLARQHRVRRSGPIAQQIAPRHRALRHHDLRPARGGGVLPDREPGNGFEPGQHTLPGPRLDRGAAGARPGG